MSVLTAIDVAKWFIKQNLDNPRNTLDGNMKLQKLLYFAQLVHLARYNEPLFTNDIRAFEKGSVVESVRSAYYYDHLNLLKSAYEASLNFLDHQIHTLEVVKRIFGDLRASELSDLNHEHRSWQVAYERSLQSGPGSDVISLEDLRENEAVLMRDFLESLGEVDTLTQCEIVNGKRFYYDPSVIKMDGELLSMLKSFEGQDTAYTVAIDESVGVIIY